MKLLLSIILLFYTLFSDGQNTDEKWKQNPFTNLGFTQNLGKFENVLNTEILFYADYAQHKIFITKTAIIIGKKEIISAKEFHERHEKIEHGQTVQPIPWHYFKLSFLNANFSSQILPTEIKHHTRNFSDPNNPTKTIKAKAYDFLTIQNIYTNIDLQLELPKQGGLKYSFLVHPGGNVNDIQIEYENITVEKAQNGSLIMENNYSRFTDRAPIAFQDTTTLKCEFSVTKNTVSFQLENYDSTAELIIDPWLETMLPFVMFQAGYDIAYDDFGNCTIIGGTNFEVAHYDNAGLLQWVWSFVSDGSDFHGDIDANPVTGNLFPTIGFKGEIRKLSEAGAVLESYLSEIGTTFPFEIWRTVYDNEENKLFLANGGTVVPAPSDSYPYISTFETDLTGMTTHIDLDSYSLLDGLFDVSLLEMDPEGTYYYMLISGTNADDPDINNRIYKMSKSDPELVIWEDASKMDFRELLAAEYVQPHFPFYTNGFNGLACAPNSFLYVYNGQKLVKRNKDTGEKIDSLFIGDTPFIHGGIDVDDCGIVYVGTADSILAFNTLFEKVGGYAIDGACYDIKINGTSLYACGEGFVTEIELDDFITIDLTATNSICESCSGSVAVSTDGCPAFTFDGVVWSPGGATDPLVTGLCAGWYTASVSWATAGDETIIIVDSVEVIATESEITVTQIIENAICLGLCNGSVVFSPTGGIAPYSFDLEGEINGTGEFTDLCAGLFEIIITDANGCAYTDSVLVESGEDLELDILTYNPPTCYGFADGSITVEAATDIGEITYTWLPENPVIGSTFNNLSAGFYTVIADNGNCTDTLVIELIEPDSIYADLLIQASCFSDSSGIVVVDSVYNAQGDLNDLAYFWVPNFFGEEGIGIDSAYNMPTGNYSLTINDANGCSTILEFSIGQYPELYFTELGFDPAYCRIHGGQSGKGVVFAGAAGGSPGYDYLWKNLSTLAETENSTWGGLNPGLYEITVTDNNGCTLIETIRVDSVNPIAAFTVNSDQLDANCEGTELVSAIFTNESSYFSNPNDPTADTLFSWNLNTPIANWQLSHSFYQKYDTTYIGEAIYPVCLVAFNQNGCTDTTCKDIIVHVQPKFTAPNIFSPGGNGINDVFTFEFLTIGIETFHCTIVNRWGKTVAEINDITQGWYGNDLNGNACTDGVYFYVYQAVSTNHTSYNGQGTVQLVRR